MYAFSEMAEHMSMLREFYAHLADLFAGVEGTEDRESPFSHSKNKKIITEKFRVPHIWPFSGPWRRRNRATLTGCQD